MACACTPTESSIGTLFRCEECYHARPCCGRCMVASHAQMPFHRITEWCETTGFWGPASLFDIDMKVCLGHGGAECPRKLRRPRKMTIGLESGFQSALVVFCDCLRPGHVDRVPDAVQLIEFGLYPTSWVQPQSAFSIRVHRAYHLLSLQAQTNAQDFTTYLRRLTDNVMIDESPDRYREFYISNREFAFLRAVRRAGQSPRRNLPAGSLAVLCPACPQLDINMDPNWRTRPTHLRFVDALFHGIDGNFHQNQKVKPLDPNDFALTLGSAYFANAEDFVKYQETLGPMEPEPSTCHKFHAMGLGGYWNNISGTLGVSCKHQVVVPGGGVDLQKGERFANVDFAMVSGLQRWMDLQLHVSGYDINCQYRINLDKRMKHFRATTQGFSSIPKTIFPPTIACVGKFHLPAHVPACRYKFSYMYMPGVGRTDGEAPERIWAALNALGTSTREMTSGHRHDRINDHHSDMNVRRVHRLPTATVAKHREALAGHEVAQDLLNKTEAQIPTEMLEDWKKEEEDWLAKVVDIKNHATLNNPYEAENVKGLSQKAAAYVLQAGEKITGSGPVEPGLVGTIGEGIDLQHAKALLLALIEEDFEADKVRTAEARKAFLSRIAAWRLLSASYLTPLIEAAALAAGDGDHPIPPEDLPDDEPDSKTAPAPAGFTTKGPLWQEINDVVIDLPSSRGPKTIAHTVLKRAAEVELELRQGEANDALDELRTQIITNYATQRLKRNVKGIKNNTRANRTLQHQRNVVNQAADRYRRARNCMIALGMNKNDSTYRELTAKDKIAFKVYSEDDQLGDSKKASSWIWSTFGFVDQMGDGPAKEACATARKVRWFRQHASVMRWQEEILILQAEMLRIARYFNYFEELWNEKASAHDDAGEKGQAAYARR
ncbi:hypothetical protein BV25DRAFT_1806721 [Artomyces pyxidatus]|uniref:Uncharacterized protein n=1 Tax=Artomyces pyxidatus TaxID=48021 RepID=A0ACB8SX00_9AGAM|nr:hypothetical protein BV25DRAFT_1806721 [Artomyces pyxidatus]